MGESEKERGRQRMVHVCYCKLDLGGSGHEHEGAEEPKNEADLRAVSFGTKSRHVKGGSVDVWWQSTNEEGMARMSSEDGSDVIGDIPAPKCAWNTSSSGMTGTGVPGATMLRMLAIITTMFRIADTSFTWIGGAILI